MTLTISRIRRLSAEQAMVGVLSVATSIYTFWLSSNRTWNPDYIHVPSSFSAMFFRDQAKAILHGGLSVPESEFANECFYRAGKCYGYFGVFPSLVRIPLFIMWRNTSHNFAPLSIAIAAGIAIWASLFLVTKLLDSPIGESIDNMNRQLIITASFLLLGTGGSLITLAQAKVYREAIIWMVALMMVAFVAAHQWVVRSDRRFLVLALIAAIGAANSRPAAIPAVAILGMWLYIRRFVTGRKITINLSSLEFALMTIPAASALFIFYLKFHQFTPPTKAYADYLGPGPTMIRKMNGGQMEGLRFLPTNVYQYLRIDSVKYSLSAPWGTTLVPDSKPAILLPPIVPNGILTEPTASLTNTMPIQLALTLAAVGAGLWKRRISMVLDHGVPSTVTSIASAAMFLGLMVYSTASRYLGDFFPALALGTIFGGIGICSWLNQKRALRIALLLIIPVAGYFSLVQYSLNIGGWGPIS